MKVILRPYNELVEWYAKNGYFSQIGRNLTQSGIYYDNRSLLFDKQYYYEQSPTLKYCFFIYIGNGEKLHLQKEMFLTEKEVHERKFNKVLDNLID